MTETIKKPEECESLKDIRQGIDHIDGKIVALLGERMNYVLNAAKFKPDLTSIPAPDRVAEMLVQRKQWAATAKLSEDFVVPLFSQIIQWFIQQQIKHWKNKNER